MKREEIFTVERIVAHERRTPSLVHFAVSRPPGYRFTPGHYGRLGLGPDDAVLWRPYSIASGVDEERLGFQLTCAPGGAFSERFCGLGVGDAIRVDARSFGFLTIDALQPGGTLWMLGTGTGLAPYLAILDDPRTFERHRRAVLVHSVRHAAELAPDAIDAAMARHAPEVRERLVVVPVVTRETLPCTFRARIGELLRGGALEEAAGIAITPDDARAMLCGNPEMVKEVRQLLRERGLEPGRRGVPGTLMTEGYW